MWRRSVENCKVSSSMSSNRQENNGIVRQIQGKYKANTFETKHESEFTEFSNLFYQQIDYTNNLKSVTETLTLV